MTLAGDVHSLSMSVYIAGALAGYNEESPTIPYYFFEFNLDNKLNDFIFFLSFGHLKTIVDFQNTVSLLI